MGGTHSTHVISEKVIQNLVREAQEKILLGRYRCVGE
jgi:hypothetical protein